MPVTSMDKVVAEVEAIIDETTTALDFSVDSLGSNGAIRLTRCSGTTVRNCDASSSGTGIRLYSGCASVVLEDNDCRSSNFGITVGLDNATAAPFTVDVILSAATATGGTGGAPSLGFSSPFERLLIHGHCHQKTLFGTASMKHQRSGSHH